MTGKKYLILVLILIVGLVMRVYSIDYGLPYVVGPDETRQVLDALGMAARGSLIPGDFAYASLHKYFLLAIYGTYFVFGKVAGLFVDKFDFAFKFFTQPYNFYLLARLFSAFLGTAIIFLVYKTAQTIFDSRVGLIAASLAALNFHLVQLSYWTSSDIVLVFFSALSLFFIFRLLQNKDLGSVMAASLSVGLSISSKFQGVMLIVPLMAAIVLVFAKGRHLLKVLFISMPVLFFSSLIGNVQYLVKSKQALQKFMEIFSASQFGISSTSVFEHNIFGSSLWYFQELVRQDGLIGLLFFLGAVYALLRPRIKVNVIFVLFLCTFLVFFSRSSLRYVYYGALILPPLAIFAAKFIQDIYYRLRFTPLLTKVPRAKSVTGFTKPVVIFLFSVVVAISFVDISSTAFRRRHLDTRQLVKGWIESNIPAGSTIAVDWYELNVPLESDIPVMVRTGNALNFYRQMVPDSLSGKFASFLKQNRKYYNIISVIYEKKDNFLPPGIPNDAIASIKRSPFALHLYSRFNFLDLETLRRKKVQYLLISSYAYSHFLLDNDPQNTGIFNPYLKEDVLRNTRQAAEYNPEKKESVLFFLAKRARDFYLPILNSQDKRAVLIKEFKPGRFNLGPVIKVYKLS